MKIAVTGANGYLGSGIVKRLLDDGEEVIGSDICDDFIDRRAEIITCNIFDLKEPYSELGKPDVLLHLAWQNGFEHYADSHILNLPGHFEFIRKMLKSGLHRICVMGSMHEVGFYEGSIDENTPTDPQSLYGIGKDALRKTVKLLSDEYGAIFQWIRGFYIVGNTERGSSIFSKIAKAAKNGQRSFPFTTGINQFDFIDYDTFCFQTAAVAEQEDINGIINCCSGIPERISARVERFIKENNYDIRLEYGKFPDRPYDSKAVWGNDSKIREIIRRRDG